MDPILGFLSTSFLILCLFIAALNFIVKTVIEFYDHNVRSLLWFEDIFLMILPIVFGALTGALVSSYPYPVGFTSTASHVIFGVVAGLLASTVGKVTIAALKLLVQTANAPNPPAPPVIPPPMSPPPSNPS
jgi:hypothetical protein